MSAVPAAGHFRLRRGPEQWPLANRRHRACTPLDSFLSEDLAFTREGQSEHDFSCWRPLRPPLDAVLAHVADE